MVLSGSNRWSIACIIYFCRGGGAGSGGGGGGGGGVCTVLSFKYLFSCVLNILLHSD